MLVLLCLIIIFSFSGPAEAGEATDAKVQVEQSDFRTKLDSLLHKIEAAGQRGVGIKSYLDAYSGIEADYKAGAKPDALQQRITSLGRALEEQSARANYLKEQKLPLTSFGKVLKGDDGVNYGPFMADLQMRIRRGWHPPKLTESYNLMTLFKINRSGEVFDIKIVEPHTLESVNEAALKAIKGVGPLKFPEGSREKTVDIEFSFEYNSSNGGVKPVGAK